MNRCLLPWVIVIFLNSSSSLVTTSITTLLFLCDTLLSSTYHIMVHYNPFTIMSAICTDHIWSIEIPSPAAYFWMFGTRRGRTACTHIVLCPVACITIFLILFCNHWFEIVSHIAHYFTCFPTHLYNDKVDHHSLECLHNSPALSCDCSMTRWWTCPPNLPSN